MKRYLDWFLKTLVVFSVLGALFKRSKPDTTPAVGPSSVGVTALPGAAAMVAATGQLPSAEHGVVAPMKSLMMAIAQRFKEHNTSMIAASLSYYALFALFPTLIATVSIYGLISDPEQLEQQVQDLTDAVPGATGEFVADQLTTLVSVSPSGLGIASAIAIAAALWSASAGTKALISAINIAYDARDSRNYLVQRAIALGVTLGAIVLGVVMAAVVAFLPQILSAVGMAEETATVITWMRWPVILLVVLLGIGALYKFAPSRSWRKTPLISIGAGVAALAWLMATLGLAVYVDNFSSLPETYGTLTGVVVTMMWFFVSALVILAGAELNSELEHRQAYAGRIRGSR